jgi:hypothetical protein
MADSPTPLVRTRRSLHAVAEHVLGAALHAATGHIGLRAASGGFATPAFPAPTGTRCIRVEDTELVVTDDGVDRRAPLTTVGAAAALVGVEPGAPSDVYTPATALEPDRPLVLDVDSVRVIAAFFATAETALAALAREESDATPGGGPVLAQLWPEHFDLALTLDEVNYGGSPGDDDHPLPYLYVGPWNLPTGGEPFWNEAFGASLTTGPGLDAADAVAFFREGLRRTRT